MKDIYTVPTETTRTPGLIPKTSEVTKEGFSVFSTPPKEGLTDIYIRPPQDKTKALVETFKGKGEYVKTSEGSYFRILPEGKVSEATFQPKITGETAKPSLKLPFGLRVEKRLNIQPADLKFVSQADLKKLNAINYDIDTILATGRKQSGGMDVWGGIISGKKPVSEVGFTPRAQLEYSRKSLLPFEETIAYQRGQLETDLTAFLRASIPKAISKDVPATLKGKAITFEDVFPSAAASIISTKGQYGLGLFQKQKTQLKPQLKPFEETIRTQVKPKTATQFIDSIHQAETQLSAIAPKTLRKTQVAERTSQVLPGLESLRVEFQKPSMQIKEDIRLIPAINLSSHASNVNQIQNIVSSIPTSTIKPSSVPAEKVKPETTLSLGYGQEYAQSPLTKTVTALKNIFKQAEKTQLEYPRSMPTKGDIPQRKIITTTFKLPTETITKKKKKTKKQSPYYWKIKNQVADLKSLLG
jgi:hypothetical protein